jgi:hypothetical protein
MACDFVQEFCSSSQVWNYGISGSTATQWAADNSAWVQAAIRQAGSPTHVVVMLPFNDWGLSKYDNSASFQNELIQRLTVVLNAVRLYAPGAQIVHPSYSYPSTGLYYSASSLQNYAPFNLDLNNNRMDTLHAVWTSIAASSTDVTYIDQRAGRVAQFCFDSGRNNVPTYISAIDNGIYQAYNGYFHLSCNAYFRVYGDQWLQQDQLHYNKFGYCSVYKDTRVQAALGCGACSDCNSTEFSGEARDSLLRSCLSAEPTEYYFSDWLEQCAATRPAPPPSPLPPP